MKRLSASFLIACLSSAAFGQQPYPFDRLFTTPEQRRVIDEYRRTGETGQKPAVANPEQESVATLNRAQSVRFSGYIERSDGSYMVWVDGRSELSEGGAAKAGVRQGALRPGMESLRFQSRDKAVSLKPGQVWMLHDDRVVESYEVPATETPPTPAPVVNENAGSD